MPQSQPRPRSSANCSPACSRALAAKVADDERTIGVEFPQLTAPDGSWVTLPASLSAG